MSNSAATSGFSEKGSSASPPSSEASPPPPLSSPPPSKDNAGSSAPSPPPPSSPPPSSSPPPKSPPPPLSSSSPPPSSKSSPPPPSPPAPTNTPPSNSGAPDRSPPPPTSTSPPPSSTQKSPPLSPITPTPTSSSKSPPPTPSIQASPPSPRASPPPPSPPSPVTVSPSGSSTTPAPPPPIESVAPPPPPILDAPTTPSNTPPSSPGNHQTQTISPPTSGRIPLDNKSKASPGTTNNSKVSSNSTGQESNGSASMISSTQVIIGMMVASALLISLIAIFSIVISRRKKKKEAAYPHYLPPKSFKVQAGFVNADGFFYGQQQNSMGFSGPAHFSCGSQVVPHSPHGSCYGCGSQKGNMYTGPDSGVLGASTAFISYEQVMEITNGFAHQNIIGEGGFGSVYKGYMPDGKVVAVKQLKAGSGQGDREFKAEVEIISRVHHRHLVSLVGYCIADNQRLLIYEFVPNKTLEHHLHSKGLQVLDWTKRLKIAIGSGKGLAYLHEDCHPKIIHRDIKSANILLDDDFEAQVADFGLARMNDTTQTHVSTRVMGTFGYLAPEYASSGKLTDRSDVFSFGVVLLELITGRKPVDPTQPLGDESLVEWARPILVRALETGDVNELVDPRLQNHYVESEMLRMVETAAACVRHSAPKRPRMVQVVRSLDSEGEVSDLSNGVKYGQSTVYDSGQYNEDIMKFRKMALGGQDSSEFDGFSGDYTAVDSPGMPSSSEFTSGESETRAMAQRGGSIGSHRKYGGY